jgi:hypothetical protein
VRPAALLFLCLGGCAGAAPSEETIVIPGTRTRIEMVYVSGDARLHPFWISKHEVTWADFDRFYQYPEEERLDGVTRPSSGKNYLQLSGVPSEQLEEERPVSNLRFHSAISYCEWLSRKTGLLFRLPTEVEWLARPLESQSWQYCLEPDRPPDFGPVLRGRGRRTPPPEWDEADPNRPLSTWWYRTGEPQGFRIVRVPQNAPADERSSYAARIRISGLQGVERTAKVGKITSFYSRVTGEVTNDGARTLDELLLKVYYLNPKGKPHFEDVTSNLTRRATFNVCAPVLRNSAHAGAQREPLRPGESRAFVVDVPSSFDADTDVDAEKFGASVLHLQFAD